MSKIKNKIYTTTCGRKGLRELKDYNLINNCYIDEIERSKSNNSKCHRCGGRIGKNTLRGVQNKLFKGEKTFNMRFVYCSKCTIRFIEKTIEELRHIKNLLKERERTRGVSYKKQEDLRLKDDILNKLSDDFRDK